MIVTDFGVAVVEGDSHLSKWIIEQSRLDVQDLYCRLFQKYIPEGGVVVDAGACLGDHTLSYSRMVGANGTVHAFEPNPVAFECLRFNFRNSHNVRLYNAGLGRTFSMMSMEPSETQSDNLGACRMVSHPGLIPVRPLDRLNLMGLNFMKIDVEGMELDVLIGAERTIRKFRPVMLIEVNRPVLDLRQISTWQIFHFLEDLDYNVMPSESHLSLELDNVDVLAIPK